MKNRIVIKIGSDSVSNENSLNYRRINSLAREISQLRQLGYEILVVSSGAVASGMHKFSSTGKSGGIAEKRALAAIGQCYLMGAWIQAFHPVVVAQTLLTWRELETSESSRKARETLCRLVSEGVVPIINENDVIADDELRFTDNDQLAVMVSQLIGAERLIILTDVDGLFTMDPKKHSKTAKRIGKVVKVTDEVLAMISDSKSNYGKGGMYSKVTAAKEAAESGIITNIINGRKRGLLVKLLASSIDIGTEFYSVDSNLHK